MTVDDVLRILRATPPRIAEATAGLSPAQAREAPAEGEWSVNEILAHLRSCADVWGEGIATMLREDQPVIRALSPRNPVHRKDYPDMEFGPSLRAFTAQREGLLAILDGLPPEGWARTATVTGAGAPYSRTVLDFAERLAVHERGHVRHIARVAGSYGC